MASTQTEQVYDFIRTYIHEVGYPPHIREVAEGCSLPPSKVLVCLSRLQTSGKLLFRPDRPRGIYLLPEHLNQPHTREIQTAR